MIYFEFLFIIGKKLKYFDFIFWIKKKIYIIILFDNYLKVDKLN